MSFRSNLRLVPLGDVAQFINGDRSTNYPKGDDYVDDGTPFISATDLNAGRVDYSSVRRISRAAYEKLRSGKVQNDDVLFCLRGSIGKIAYVKESQVGAIASSLVIVRATEKIDPRYLFFSLSGKAAQQAALGRNNGAAQPNLSVGELQKICLPLPSVPIQRRIAFILGAYDDLIEVNRRRVAVLEEMARGLFEEWFVRFRFPGHESAPILDTPDGPLPQGWEFKRLQDFLVLQRGFDLPTEQRTAGEVPVISASGVHGTHSAASVRGPGVVTGRSGTIGQVHLVMENFWPLNTTLYVKAFKKAGPAYATLLLRHFDLAQHRSGSAVPTLNRNHVHGAKVVAAPDELLHRFEVFAMRVFQSVDVIRQQNRVLAASRDILLPRLISGQLSVASAERELEQVG